MATSSELSQIRSNPIKGGLDPFRRLFERTRVDLGIPASAGVVHAVFSTAVRTVSKNLVLDLILALQSQPAARILPSRNGYETLLGDLSGYVTLVDSNNFDIKAAMLLVERVVDNAPDVEIWRAVFDLVALTSPKQSTPPTAFEKAVVDTPLRSSSASQRGIEQTHDEVDQRILEELTGRVYYDVGGFFEQYFEEKTWSNQAADICEKAMAQHAEERWSGWPEPSLQASFFKWFMKFQDTVLSRLSRRYYTSANRVLRGSEADRKLDIFLTPTDAALLAGEHDWSNVLVIGEHKQNPDEDRSVKTLVQLAGYVREVFGSQPERRFVPGFTICGSIMRLWMVDRSGVYSSENFDIHQAPQRFIRVITGYMLMTDAELGLNTFIKRNGSNKHIVVRDVRISLENKPIASTKAIICRGTTCYRGRRPDSTDWEYVVKFAWPSSNRQREGDLLKLAKDRGVKGISEWFHHEQITINGNPDTIAHFRRGMKFGAPRKLSSKASWVDGNVESSRATSRTRLTRLGRSMGSAARLTGPGISTSSTTMSSSRKKRKGDGEFVDGTSGKRSKSIESRCNVADVEITADPENREPDTTGHYSIQDVEPDSLAGCESETYGNRIHCCLVVSPAGRPLYAYRSVRELLETLRDAVWGHKSLLEDGKILHRDISENNIIITNSKGMLIDLDLAKELDSPPSGASHRTGTMQFMSIEVLQGKGHTYRHDLESLFYVFLWMCIRYGHEDVADMEGADTPSSKSTKKTARPIKTSRLRGWYTGTYAEIANTKRGHMDKNGFEDTLAEFAPKFEELKQLARELRSILFPIRDGAIFTGTFRDHDIMYNGMVNAFSRAISRLGNEEPALI